MISFYTIEQYETLCAALKKGSLVVNYGNKEIEYRSMSEMKLVKKHMEVFLFPKTKKEDDLIRISHPIERFLRNLSTDISTAKNKLIELSEMKRFDDLFTNGERCSIQQIIKKLEDRSSATKELQKHFL